MSIALDTAQPVVTGPPLPDPTEAGFASSNEDPGNIGMNDWGSGLDALFLDQPLPGSTPVATPPVDSGPPAASPATQGQAPSPSPSSPSSPPSSDPATPPAEAASQSDTVEALRAELETVKEASEFIKSKEYQQARVVAEVINEDPLRFVREYLPDVVEAIRSEAAVDAISQRAETPEDFALTYADTKLAEKYSDFVPDPSELLVPGSESYKYTRERERLMLEGVRVYQERQMQEQLRQSQTAQQQQASLTEAAASLGYSAADVPKLAQILESFQPTQTDYYTAVLRYMQAEGHFKDIASTAPASAPSAATATPAPAQAPTRIHDTPPPPGVQNIPGATTADADAASSLMELLGPAFN